MPLSAPAPREELHCRTVTCTGYARQDGLYDIEGHMTDIKTYPFPNKDRGGQIDPGDPLHEMWLRLTVDLDFKIHAVEACTDKSPFSICPEAAAPYASLVGLVIGPGFKAEVRRRLGGVTGCTHLTELLGPMATTTFQALFSQRKKRRLQEQGGDSSDDLPVDQDPNSRRDERRALVNSCYAFRDEGPIVARELPQFYKGTDPLPPRESEG